MWFWIIGLSVLFVGPPALIVGTSLWISTRRARRGQDARGGRDGLAGQAMRHARIGRLGGLGVGALAGAVAFLAGFGMIAPILVPVGYLVGVLITELRPARPTGPIRVASLQARDAWKCLPKWVVPAILAAAALALAAPIGRSRANTARAIAGAVLGIELLALGGLAIVASRDVGGPFAHAGAGYLGSRILVWSGLGLALAGMLTWAVLGRWRSNAVAPPEPGDQGPATPRIA